MTSPSLPPAPATGQMGVAELDALVRAGGPYRGRAVFELIDRSATDPAAVAALGELAKLPLLQTDRAHEVTLAWAAIIGLLATETAASRELAYAAFAALPTSEQPRLLAYLKTDQITDAHPPRP